MKNRFKHPTDITEPLTGAEITGMTFAGTALSVLSVVISVYIVYFFTNIAGISVAVVGTLLLVTRVADGFSDLTMSIIVKRTKSRWGQARPWSLIMALPLLISVILVFYIPENWNQTAKTVYACITYFLMITVAITPASLIGSILGSNMTVNSKSRQKNAMVSTPFVLAGSVVGTMVVLQITQEMGDSFESWRLVAVIFGLLAFAGQLVQFFLTKERNIQKETTVKPPASSLKEHIPAILKNKYFIIMALVGLMMAVDGAMAACSIYYLRYVLSRMELIGVLGILTMLPMLAGVALTPVIAKKIPVRTLIIAGLVVKIITYAINMMFPGNAVLFLSFSVLRGLTGAPLMVNSSVYLLNTIEYGEYKTGIRANHLILSASSVMSKIGTGLGGALIGWMLSWGGYDGTAEVQSVSAQNMIVSIYFLIPLVAAVLILILLSMYNLDKKYSQIVDTLKTRAAVA